MIPLETARSRMLEALGPTETVSVEQGRADGCTLAEPLIAQRTQPPFAASAMDGYAVHAADLGEAATILPLAGEAAAGHALASALPRGHAARISTGAPLPAGADQVVMQERATRADDHVTLDDAPRPMANIRPAGTDYAAGDTLLEAGQRLTPEAIALAVGAGETVFAVHRQPRIGILATGDELVEPGETPGPDQIVNSVSRALAGLISAWDCEPVYLGIARDTPDSVAAHLDRAEGLDLLVTVGGASVGDHDHLRAVFTARGGRLAFERIALKPGKPTWFGRLDALPCLGLPGNPVSALVVARLLLAPAAARLSGRAAIPTFDRAKLAADLPANGSRETYLRAGRDEAGRVAVLDNQDSSALSALVRADCLVRRMVDAPPARTGDTVEVLVLAP
jgi:molybdopterin molybdotransferase